MTSIELTAPAKVNLFLKVLDRRNDGYHNILTLFEKITLADKIKISKTAKGIRVTSDKFITPDPRDNIIYKAASLISARKRLKSGVNIELEKRIPVGAGLGGGSSDAASVLIGMNKLFNMRLKKEELAALAKELGADVPFFIFGAPFAVGRGRGDVLEKVNFRTSLWHLIIYPGFRVLTKDIYEAYDAFSSRKKRDSTYSDKRTFRLALRQNSISSLEHLLRGLTRNSPDDKIHPPLVYTINVGAFESMIHNDLEGTVVAQKRAVGKVMKRLASSLQRKTIVSGSGPSVFCLYETRKEAMEAKERLLGSVPAAESKKWQVFIARTTR